MRRDTLGEQIVGLANDGQRLIGGQLVSVQARALADQLEVDADLIHLLHAVRKVGGVVIVDLRPFPGELGKCLYRFRGRMMRVPINPSRHGGLPSYPLLQADTAEGLGRVSAVVMG